LAGLEIVVVFPVILQAISAQAVEQFAQMLEGSNPRLGKLIDRSWSDVQGWLRDEATGIEKISRMTLEEATMVDVRWR